MLEQLFGSKTRVKLLNLFFQSPSQSFYLREISRAIGSQLNAVRREVNNLEKMGLIGTVEPPEEFTGKKAIGTKRSKYYQIKTDCLIFFELKSLLLKAQLLEEREMVEEMKKKVGDLKLLILTGTFTDVKEVDTDILLVGRVKPLVLARLIKGFEKKLGRSIRYTTMTESEFVERRHVGDKFLYNLFANKNIPVIDYLS